MLAIRLQRTGRSGHSQFRVIAQDSRFSPKRGRVVAYLGSYNPHTKEAKLNTEKIGQYLDNGAQPSDSAAKLLRKEGVKMPAWVKTQQPKQRIVRNADKRRSTRPAEAEAPAETEAAASDEISEEPGGTENAPEPSSQAAEPETPSESTAEPAPDKTETATTGQPEPAEENTETPADQT